jgi:adenylate kinase
MLATELGAKYVGITDLVKTQNLVSTMDTNRDTLVADTKAVKEKLQTIMNQTQNLLVIDGHYAADVVDKENVQTAFVLRRDPQQLKTTLQNRNYKENKIWENLEAEILDVCLWDAVNLCGINKVCEIDTTNKTPEQTVQQMLDTIRNPQNCKVGLVDWLGTLEKAGKLEDYMQKINLTKQP